MSGQPVIGWSVSRLEALSGGTSSPSISPRPQWAGPPGILRYIANVGAEPYKCIRKSSKSSPSPRGIDSLSQLKYMSS